MKIKVFLFGILWAWEVQAQNIKGRIMYLNAPVSKAIVQIQGSKKQAITDSTGYFEMMFSGTYCQLSVHYPGFLPYTQKLVLSKDSFLTIELKPDTSYLYEVWVEDTKLLATKKPDPFNTEVYDACILHSASAVSLFEGVQNINGLRPQLNCNICNTGDIHINGMEGPYTNVLIDGMPVIGGIASVYGLTGIASDIIERMEINRYPGSVVYGSDNIGGTINIITKTPTSSKFKTDVQFYTSSYFDNNLDISFQKKIRNYGFINSFNLMYFDKRTDSNQDNFTDVTLQKRFSGFHKSRWTFKDSSIVQCIVRGLIEDRWGGQLNWNKHFRGSDSIYGESIITKRLESITHYSLYLGKHKIENALSYNYHYQDSYYGTLFFEAAQHNLYYQTYTDWYSKKSRYTLGLTFKYLYYKDNTEVFKNTTPYSEWLVPGIFSENTFTLSEKLKLLLSFRYDYHNIHKHIWTPRIAGIFSNPSKTFTWRNGVTTGFRPVQLFTEDHAALTGARKVILQEKLKPEKSMAIYFILLCKRMF